MSDDKPKTELATYQPRDLEVNAAADVMRMMDAGVKQGVDVESLERLTGLYERMADRAAAHEFNAALSDFQRNVPPIPRDTVANIQRQGGGHSHRYRYAKLEAIAAIIAKPLAERGFSYTWDQKVDRDMLTVTCVLAHLNGHSRSASFTAPTESKAGMSPQQKHAAAHSFAKRQSLISVLGITTADPDDDAGGALLTIDDKQFVTLRTMLDELPKEVEARMLKHYSVSKLEDLAASSYAVAADQLRRKLEERG